MRAMLRVIQDERSFTVFAPTEILGQNSASKATVFFRRLFLVEALIHFLEKKNLSSYFLLNSVYDFYLFTSLLSFYLEQYVVCGLMNTVLSCSITCSSVVLSPAVYYVCGKGDGVVRTRSYLAFCQ